MSIERITTEDLRRMEGQEVLILQGCDGDLEEWMEGINEMLTQSGILLEQNLNIYLHLSMKKLPVCFFLSEYWTSRNMAYTDT